MIINIGRQLGSGGREIGQKLATHFQLKFFDKELISLAAEKSGINSKLFEGTDERTEIFHHTLLGLRMPMWHDGIHISSGLTQEVLFQIQSNVIRQVANEDNCLFVGRCADYILRDFDNCVNIFVCAHEEDRIKRISNNYQVDQKQAFDILRKTDKQRASYYNFYTEKTWGAAASYDLCINSSVLGIENTVNYLVRFISLSV